MKEQNFKILIQNSKSYTMANSIVLSLDLTEYSLEDFL